jgi:hypothetical protein
MRSHAQFNIIENLDGKPLVIRDVGPRDKHPSVTNDADWVIQELFDADKIPNGRRVFYWDSDGRFDELVHDGAGKFKHFAPIDPTESANG